MRPLLNQTEDEVIRDTMAGPVVAASPGYALLDDDFRQLPGEPILAWKIGPNLVLPVTRWGWNDQRKFFVLCPDGMVRQHAVGLLDPVEIFDNIDAWRAR